QVGVAARDLGLQIRELAPPEVPVGLRLRANLYELACARHAGRPEQLLEFGERVVVSRDGRQDADGECTLTRPRVLDSRSARRVAGFGGASLAGSGHCPKCRSTGDR